MELTLSRKGETANSTYGELKHGDKHLCFIIEDGHRKTKVPGETRIPAGRYKIERQTSGRFYADYKRRWNHQWVPRLLDVPGFEGILIHAGNTKDDTRGCLLPNLKIRHDGTNYVGENSVIAYQILYNYLNDNCPDIYELPDNEGRSKPEDIFITITDPK